ncbi:LutC/YkgG family protein [Hydrocarboniphaga effusa]|uniref:LutC/YkgG family protein n=1 Tax=Hydrocarboniphaga effusa TaxID=243629 RepID=UPI00398C0009
MSASNSGKARDNILSRLRSAEPGKLVGAPDIASYYRDRPQPKAEESRRERFIRNATSWRAEIVEASESDWPGKLVQVIEHKRLGKLLVGRNTTIGWTLSALLPPEQLYWYERDLAEIKSDLFDHVDAGISTTLGGVAETGSLLLWPTPAEPRTLSLIPPVHIALLFEDQIVETLHEAMMQNRWSERMPTNLLMITGPSKTADIQRMLVYGAHGPKELVIVLVSRQASPNGESA